MPRKLIVIFVFAFILNLIWEEAHSALYVSYQGGSITNLVLLRAALFDAAVITLFFFGLSPFRRGRIREGVAVIALIVFAILLEKWALDIGRWAYTDAMPLIPLLNVGLTPAIQLGLLGYVSIRVSGVFTKKRPLARPLCEESDL